MWRGEDGAEDRQESGGAGLLDTGFEKVGGLEKDRGAEAGEESGEEVEDWRGPWSRYYILRCRMR